MSNKLVVIARIGSYFGFKGWMHIYSETDPADNLFTYKPIYYKDKNTLAAITIEHYKVHGNHFIVKISEINSKEETTKFTNALLYVERKQFAQIPDDTYYYSDLENLTVLDTKNTTIGIVKWVMQNKGNDILVIQTNTEKELLVPFKLDIFIKNIDLDNNVIVLNEEMINFQ